MRKRGGPFFLREEASRALPASGGLQDPMTEVHEKQAGRAGPAWRLGLPGRQTDFLTPLFPGEHPPRGLSAWRDGSQAMEAATSGGSGACVP